MARKLLPVSWAQEMVFFEPPPSSSLHKFWKASLPSAWLAVECVECVEVHLPIDLRMDVGEDASMSDTDEETERKMPKFLLMNIFSARWLLSNSARDMKRQMPLPYFANVRHLTIHKVAKQWATILFHLFRSNELQQFSWVKLTYEQHDNAYTLEAKTNQPPSVDLSIIKEVNRARSQAWQNVIPNVILPDNITDREALFLTENTAAVKLGPDFHFFPAERWGQRGSGHSIRKAYRDITVGLQQRYPGCFTGFAE